MYKLIFLLILLENLMFANIDLVQTYRNYGIKEVEKIINKQLINKNYWNENLKNKNTKNGYYESLNYVVMCNKDQKEIKIYDTKKNNIIYSADVITGKNIGNKQVEGDLKTPVGVYKLLSKLDKLDSFYGPFALKSDYPNEFDNTLNKTGHGIWIHGLPYKQSRDPYTKGCIALKNNNLIDLEKSINIKKSVLIISENNNLDVNKNDISIILSQIYLWRNAWKYSHIDKYLSFYSKEFKRKDKSGLNKFATHKKRIFAKNQYKIIKLTNINIIPYPNDLNKNMYKVTMDEDYKANNYKFIGKKILYIEILNNQMKILFE